MSAFYKTDPLLGNPILFIHYISDFQIVFCSDMGLWRGTLGFYHSIVPYFNQSNPMSIGCLNLGLMLKLYEKNILKTVPVTKAHKQQFLVQNTVLCLIYFTK